MLIEVSLIKDSTKHAFLVDVSSKEIVMRSSTEHYGWMIDWDKKHFGSRRGK